MARTGSLRICCDGRLYCRRGAPGCPANRGILFETWAAEHAPRALAASRAQNAPPPRVTLAAAEGGAVEAKIREALAWAAAGPGRVAVVPVTVGTGKTRTLLRVLAETGGTFLAPDHRRAQEFMRRFKEFGVGEPRYLEGISRRITDRDMRTRVEAFAGAGYPPQRIVDEDDCRPMEGPPDARVVFAAHEALPVMLDGERDDGEPVLPGPIVADEMPPLTRRTVIPLRDFSFLTALHGDPAVDRWCRQHGSFAAVWLTLAQDAIAERRSKPRNKCRYAEHIMGGDLAERARRVLASVSGGAEEWLRGWLFSTGANAMSLSRMPIPGLSPVLARTGQQVPKDVPRGDWYSLLPALALALFEGAEGRDFRVTFGGTWAPLGTVTFTSRGGVALVVSGDRDGATAEVHVCEPWSDRIRNDLSFVILDATARHVRDAVRAAWPRREVQFFSLDVESSAPWMHHKVWVRANANRTTLIANGHPRPRAVPFLAKLVERVAAETRRRIGPASLRSRATVGIVAYKAMLPLLGAAIRAALRQEPATPDSDWLSRVPGTDRLVEAFRRALEEQAVSFDARTLGTLGAVRGTNTMEHHDALVCFPFFPNVGAAALDALALRIPAPTYIAGVAEAELEQAQGRLRQVRATDPKVVFQLSSRQPAGEGWESMTLPRGRLRSAGWPVVEAGAADVLRLHGAVSPALMRRLGDDPFGPRLYTATDSPNSSLEPRAEAGELRGALDMVSRATLQRIVSGVARAAGARQVSITLAGRRALAWEIRPGAAQRLATALDAQPGLPSEP
jgi:hypothetical protein